MLRSAIGLALVMFIASPLIAAEKPTVEKLVGSWKITKGGDLPEGATATLEYTKDGKIKAVIEIQDQKITIDGTYKIDGEKIVYKLKFQGQEKEETETVTKFTDDELVTKDKDGKETTFKKVAVKKEK